MKKRNRSEIFSSDFLGCTEIFNFKNAACTRYCSVRVRCIIENNKSIQMEMMDEDLLLIDNNSVRMQ